MDASGSFYVVWIEDSSVRLATLGTGGSWSAPVPISGDTDPSVTGQVDVAAAGKGRAGVVWVDDGRIYGVVGASDGGWEAPVALSDPDLLAASPSIGFDGSLAATAVWSQGGGSFPDDAIESSVHPAGGTWGGPVRLSGAADSGVELPALAVSASGAATVAWDHATSGFGAVVQAVSRSKAGSWGTPQDLSDPLAAAFVPRAATNARGDAAVVWNQQGGASSLTQGVYRAAAGPWREASDLPDQAPGGSHGEEVAVAPDGSATAVWELVRNGTSHVQAARTLPDGSWTPPVDVSDDAASSYAPSLAADGTGDVTAVFLAQVGFAVRVDAARLDTTGPYPAPASDTWSGATTAVTATGAGPSPTGTRQPPVITLFKVQNPAIRALSPRTALAPARTRLRIRLTSAADDRITLRSKHRHAFGGMHKRVKVTLDRRLPAGRSSLTLKGRLAKVRLPADTYRIVGTATNRAGTSNKRTARLVVLRAPGFARAATRTAHAPTTLHATRGGCGRSRHDPAIRG